MQSGTTSESALPVNHESTYMEARSEYLPQGSTTPHTIGSVSMTDTIIGDCFSNNTSSFHPSRNAHLGAPLAHQRLPLKKQENRYTQCLESLLSVVETLHLL